MKTKKTKAKALEPLIATILLIVVSVILVTIVLTWGKEFSTSSLNKTNNFAEIKASDATHFVYPKSAQDGIVQFTYSPPAEIKQDINITHYRVINIPEMTEPIALSEPKILSPSLNLLELPCLYEYSTTTPDLDIQLITSDNTYIDIKAKDTGMTCVPSGDGTEENPKIICNAEDLNAVREHLDWNYSLGKDIDLQCFSRQDVNGWEPIGDESVWPTSLFRGSFDGKNHIIKNLFINRPAFDYGLGLFGEIGNPTEIKNIGLEDVNITGYDYVGGLVGAAWGATISSCYVTGNIYGSNYTGGLVGLFDYFSGLAGNIIDSYFIGNVSGSGLYIGGLSGSNVIGILISNYSAGSVSGTEYTGGLIGYNQGDISNSYSLSSVSGTKYTGGLVGYNYVSDIASSYSTGEVNGTEYIGGFIGYGESEIGSTAYITNCYSFGNVIRSSGSDQNIASFIGLNLRGSIINSYSTGLVSGNSWNPTNKGFAGAITTGGNYADTNNFYDTTTSLQTSTAGNAVAKTTSEMKTQSTFTYWDFSSIWAIDSSKNGGYPYLRSNPPR